MLTTETNGQIKCTGSCAQEWPPLTVSAGQTPKLTAGEMGTIGTVKRPDGTTQVTYNGHPLYYYSADTSPGQATGQGIGGVWFAETVTGASSSTSTSTSAPNTTTTSGGYSY
jgi:predicted lipoprotein with Yx(FWY)xxD motif